MSKLFRAMAMSKYLSKKEGISIGKNFNKEAGIFEDVQTALKEKGFDSTAPKEVPNQPKYSGSISIPGVNGASVKCPDNPIVGNKYNVHVQIRGGEKATKAKANVILVYAEAGGMGSQENTVKYGNPTWLNRQLSLIHNEMTKRFGKVTLGNLSLGSWSGGYGAVEKLADKTFNIVDSDGNVTTKRPDDVVVLDGIHASKKDSSGKNVRGQVGDGIAPWLELAKKAKDGAGPNFTFVYTAVDPGTYASTSDAAYYLTDSLGVPRAEAKDVTYGGISPASIASQGGFRAIQLFERKSDKPGYGYPYKAADPKTGQVKPNVPGTSGWQHIVANNAIEDIMNELAERINE